MQHVVSQQTHSHSQVGSAHLKDVMSPSMRSSLACGDFSLISDMVLQSALRVNNSLMCCVRFALRRQARPMCVSSAHCCIFACAQCTAAGSEVGWRRPQPHTTQVGLGAWSTYHIAAVNDNMRILGGEVGRTHLAHPVSGLRHTGKEAQPKGLTSCLGSACQARVTRAQLASAQVSSSRAYPRHQDRPAGKVRDLLAVPGSGLVPLLGSLHNSFTKRSHPAVLCCLSDSLACT